MLPNEREYRVGPQGYRVVKEGRGESPNVTIAYEPGAFVWLRGVPPRSADLQPTGRERKYETKGIGWYSASISEADWTRITQRALSEEL